MEVLLHEAFIDCKVGETCGQELLQSSMDYMQEEASENYRQSFIKKYALESPSIVQTSVKKLIDDDIR